jgi:membrane protein required for colicin V production
MNWLDASIVIVIALGAGFGAATGAFWQVARAVMVAVGVVASLRWGGWMAGILEGRFSPGAAAVLGYALAFFFAWLAVYLLSLLVDGTLKVSELKWADRLAGGVLGGAKGALAVLVALAGLSMHPTPEFAADMRASLIAPAMLGTAKAAMPVEARRRVDWLLDQAKRRMEPLYGDAGEARTAFARALAPDPSAVPQASEARR